MVRYLVVSIVSGLLFGVMDGLINANPVAQGLYEAYVPIARTSVSAVTGIAIDLLYGFVMAGVFLLLFQCLPGESGLLKGLSYALLVWLFRVAMGVATEWMTFVIPGRALLYKLGTGLVEMLVLGVLYGLTLRPA